MLLFSYKKVFVCVLSAWCGYCCVLFASENTKQSTTAYQVDINKPTFRRLRVAMPFLGTANSKDPYFLKRHYRKFRSVLEFTGIFQVVAQVAYKGYYTLENHRSSMLASDFSKWKSIDIDSVVASKITLVDGHWALEIKTTDIHSNKVVLKRYYRLPALTDYSYVVKKYADELMRVYTGKPGIYSSQIVFVGRRTKKSKKQIFIVDVDGDRLRQLTYGSDIHLGPSWSPDRRSVVYTSYESGRPSLYLYDLIKSKQTLLMDRYSLNHGGVFSPSGKHLAFIGSKSGNSHIRLMDLSKSKKEKALTFGHSLDVDPAFSPNGKWLAFVSGRYGNPHIFRATISADSKTKVIRLKDTNRLTYRGWYNTTPAWSPNSANIAFSSFDNDIQRFDIFVMDNVGKSLRRLTLAYGDSENPTWSPNGQLIMFNSNRIDGSKHRGPSKLYIMNKDGSNQRSIRIAGIYAAYSPKWSRSIY